MNIDLNQIEAMTTNELEALYGELSNEEFRLKVSLSVVSLELETRLKSRRITPFGVEERTTSGNTRLTLEQLMRTPAHPSDFDGEATERKVRSDKGSTREGVRAIDRSSCCGAEGRRMNSDSLDCFACREVVE